MLIYIIFILVILIFLSYFLIPNYWARRYSTKVLRKGHTQKKLAAITFDDGPNPCYTPSLLDILKQFNITATFFVVGRWAKENPDIIKRMRTEGHDIGCHSYYHRHAWLMSPWATYLDMKQTYNTLKTILGNPPSRYRPPWGGYNAMSLLMGNKLNLKPTHWSQDARDWANDTTVKDIQDTIINGIKPGSIIVLHDNGGARGAPERTLKALPLILETLKLKGYRFVDLDEMEKRN